MILPFGVVPIFVNAGAAATQGLPPIRPTLEKLLARWQQPSAMTDNTPWKLREAARQLREQRVAELSAFLKAPVPTRSGSRSCAWAGSETPAGSAFISRRICRSCFCCGGC